MAARDSAAKSSATPTPGQLDPGRPGRGDDGGGSGQRLDAAHAPAPARRPVDVEAHVPDLAGVAAGPAQHVTVGDDACPDPRAHVERGEARGRVDLPLPQYSPTAAAVASFSSSTGSPTAACRASTRGKSVHARITGGVSAMPVVWAIGPGETTPRPRIRSGATPACPTRVRSSDATRSTTAPGASPPAPGRRQRLTTAPPRSAMT